MSLQAQCADIGLMGGPAKLNGKAVEGVRIFLGGTIGEGATLASEFEKGIPCEESILLPKLKDICMEHFGATPKQEARYNMQHTFGISACTRDWLQSPYCLAAQAQGDLCRKLLTPGSSGPPGAASMVTPQSLCK